MNFQVFCKSTGAGVAVVTYGALVRPLTSVDTHVCGEIPPLGESPATYVTFVLFESRVCSSVYVKRALQSKLPLTYVALIRFRSRVDTHVLGERAPVAAGCTTDMAHERFNAGVSNSVTTESSILNEGLVADLARVWALLRVDTIVSDEVTEALSRGITALVALVFIDTAMTKFVSDKTVRVVINIVTYITFKKTLIRVDQFMSSKQAWRFKCYITPIALVWSVQVRSFMIDQILRLGKRLATKLTDETLVGVHAFVVRKIRRVSKRLATNVTGVRTFICVNTSVSLKITQLTKMLVTQVTNVRLVVTAITFASGILESIATWFCRRVKLMWCIDCMTSFMIQETAGLNKGLATQVTNVRSLIGMSTLMVGKNKQFPKCLATDIAGVRPLICVNTSVSLKIRCLSKGFAARVAYMLSEGSTNTFPLSKIARVTKLSVMHVRVISFFIHVNSFTTG